MKLNFICSFGYLYQFLNRITLFFGLLYQWVAEIDIFITFYKFPLFSCKITFHKQCQCLLRCKFIYCYFFLNRSKYFSVFLSCGGHGSSFFNCFYHISISWSALTHSSCIRQLLDRYLQAKLFSFSSLTEIAKVFERF